MSKNIWLVGAGLMGIEYTKVLQGLSAEFVVIGRGEETAAKLSKVTGKEVVRGGLNAYLNTKPKVCEKAIVCVPVEHLKDAAIELIEYGVKSILVEKPGGVTGADILSLKKVAKENGAEVFLAYNRRFYASVLKAKELIDKDGGVTSFNFEFTEWAHEIEALDKPEDVKKYWFLANSTHVVDLAFFLGGKPREISSYTNGKLTWHPSASDFTGAGITEEGVPFSYSAYWASAGRWSVEVLTKENRYIFRPMEKLHVQKRGTIAVDEVEVDYSMENSYKPGFFKQVEAFINNDTNEFCDISEQGDMVKIYNKIANYL